MKLKTGIINQITFTLIMLFLTGTAFAETLLFRGSPEVSIYSTAEQGYGGAYSAYGKDIFTLFNNPALLSILQEGSIVGLGFEFPVNQNDFKELAKLFEKKSIEDSKLNDYIEKQLSFAPPYASVQGPLMFGITGKSASFGFFNRSFISSNLEYFENETIPDDTVLYRAYLHNDIIAVAGTAINLINGELHKLDLGADFKLFTRISSVLNEAKTSIPKDEDRKTTDSGGGGDRVLVGTGFDLGLLYSYGDRFSFGITARNVPCGALVIQSKEKEKAEEGFLFLPVINTGISFSLINNYFLVCNLLVDFRDILAAAGAISKISRRAELNLAAGCELIIARNLFVRVGIRDLLPSAGIGYEYNNLKFNIAIYGKEYGNYAGTYSSYTLSFSAQFVKK